MDHGLAITARGKIRISKDPGNQIPRGLSQIYKLYERRVKMNSSHKTRQTNKGPTIRQANEKYAQTKFYLKKGNVNKLMSTIE